MWLDKRRPGQSRFVTQRQEPDTVRILSGVFEGVTTGTPIALIIDNVDQRSRDYSEIKDKFRPGHADYTYLAKYGVRDYRGGGRASARETAMRVAAGAIARKVLAAALGTSVRGAVVQLGPQKIDRASWDWDQIEDNPFWSPDQAAASAGKAISTTCASRLFGRRGHRGGGVRRPGGPWRSGLRQARRRPRQGADEHQRGQGRRDRRRLRLGGRERRGGADDMRMKDGEPAFLTNHAGGILGGISTGQDVVVRFAVKPTSSILIPQQGVRPTATRSSS